MNSTPVPRPIVRHRRLKRSILLAVWLITLLALAVVEENWRQRRAWHAYLDEARAKGDPLDAASIVPPPVPDSENFAMAQLFRPLFDFTAASDSEMTQTRRDPAAVAALDHLSPWPSAIPGSFVGDTWRLGRFVDLSALQAAYRNQPDFPKSAQPQTPGEDVLYALTKFDREYDGLREAGMRPRSRFPIRYEDGVAMALPHLSVLRSLGQIVQLRAMAEISVNRPDEAFTDTLLSLRVAESLSGEPTLISMLVRVAILRGCMEPVWEGLARRQWTDPQLAALDSRLAGVNLAAEHQSAMLGERNLCAFPALDSFVQNRGRAREFLSAGNGTGGGTVLPFALHSIARFAPTFLIDANKLSIGRWYDQQIACTDAAAGRFLPDRCQRAQSELEAIVSRDRRPGNVFLRIIAPALQGLQQKFAAEQGFVNLARVAIAVERSRLRVGAYPEALSQITIAVMPGGPPLDPATGLPPRYARTGDGRYLLYYDGWNQSDDGGKPAWKDERRLRPDYAKGDWVWPQPEPEPKNGPIL